MSSFDQLFAQVLAAQARPSNQNVDFAGAFAAGAAGKVRRAQAQELKDRLKEDAAFRKAVRAGKTGDELADMFPEREAKLRSARAKATQEQQQVTQNEQDIRQARGEFTSKIIGSEVANIRAAVGNRREQAEAVNRLRKLQREGKIEPGVSIPGPLDIFGEGQALNEERVGALERAGQETGQRFADPTELTGENLRLGIVGGENFGLPQEQADALRRASADKDFRDLKKAAASATKVIVGGESGLTTQQRGALQGQAADADVALRSLNKALRILRTPEGEKLFTALGQAGTFGRVVLDSIGLADNADKSLIKKSQTVQQGVRFMTMALLVEFSGKAMTEKEREFILKATGDPDGFSPAQLITGMELALDRLGTSQLARLESLDLDAVNIDRLAKSARRALEEGGGINEFDKFQEDFRSSLVTGGGDIKPKSTVADEEEAAAEPDASAAPKSVLQQAIDERERRKAAR